MVLQGVVTTGIYCRAECGARPHAKNVRPVRNAVEALARGFRPCLSCRPDRLPDLGIGGCSPEVAHALRLISEGFLDGRRTDDLAERVGYSTRQLVRLFEDQVGASPDFVARARRAHLARRLLDESDLTVTAIAHVAGFASLRTMNRTVAELFGFSPRELRAKRSSRDPLNRVDGGLRLRVPFRGPFDAERAIEFLAPRATAGVESVDGGCYRRTIHTCGHPGLLEVRVGADREHLDVTLHLATFASIAEQLARVRALFGLDRDSAAAERALRRDPQIGPAVRRAPGLRLPGAYDRFETAVRIIVGQQVSVAGATTVTGRIVERFGEPIATPLPHGLRHLFPSPAALAAATPADLDMPAARARTLAHFARAVADGDLDLSRVDDLETTTAELEQLPGIGPWTANLIALRVCENPDAFPASDLGLRKGATALTGATELLSARATAAVAEAWRPYRSTACTYLWMETPAPGAAAAQ